MAQSVACLTLELKVLGSISGPASLSFLLPLLQEGQMSVTGHEVLFNRP